MNVRFADDRLRRLESDLAFNGGFGREVVRGYRKVMRFIRDAKDERDFRAVRSLNFEKLRGDRAGRYSMRLNRQWRLILAIETDANGNTMAVIEIVDYH